MQKKIKVRAMFFIAASLKFSKLYITLNLRKISMVRIFWKVL
jgi:hypothetical protein